MDEVRSYISDVSTYHSQKSYDVVVIGAGHAGIEAALASARMGCSTLLLSANLDTIGQMSCNPAIGGLAKGHLAREIDALGGEMGKCTDMTGLQFRMLNAAKGPSVRAPRAQCDKKAYQLRMKKVCETQDELDVKQAQVTELVVQDCAVQGVVTSLGVTYTATTVVVTTGTFLQGLMHIGKNQQAGGRLGEPAATDLSESLRRAGLFLGRLKTGTPPRISRRSIDFAQTEIQPGDEPVPCFSFWRDDLFHVEQSRNGSSGVSGHHSRYPQGSVLDRRGGQLPCYLTYTTDRTAELIRSNLHLSPFYAGAIRGVGPRYCPSIEDKIVRFPEKDRHQIFLEPEGADTEEIYLNGLSTSLPYPVQVELVRSVRGCENAEIMRPAYAVEYDYADPTQLQLSLETRACRNLYLAGQINGTSGYEEAAAQGLMAGINAGRRVRGLEPIILRRDQAYIGVMIDDLVMKGTSEPYRMFTSRAEHRLLLRQDNADMRLSNIGHEIGLLPRHNFECFRRKLEVVSSELQRLRSTWHSGQTMLQMLRRPDFRYSDLPYPDASLPKEVIEQVEIEAKYEGYIRRQENEIAKSRALEGKLIPATFDYTSVLGLRSESRQKLNQAKPRSVGEASRISGVTPADISLLLVWLKRVGNLKQ